MSKKKNKATQPPQTGKQASKGQTVGKQTGKGQNSGKKPSQAVQAPVEKTQGTYTITGVSREDGALVVEANVRLVVQTQDAGKTDQIHGLAHGSQGDINSLLDLVK